MLSKGLGFIQSPKDERDIVFGTKLDTVPGEYRVQNLCPVTDQGTAPICAAVCLSTLLSWRRDIRSGMPQLPINVHDIYSMRGNENMQGMIIRDALKAIKRNGVGGETIKSYARVMDPLSAKIAILLGGPVIIGTFAYNDNKFWKPAFKGEGPQGGHATLLIGWNEKGFVLRNSWGSGWKTGGCIIFPEEDWESVLECWTVIA